MINQSTIEQDTGWLTHANASKLLRLYLAWPLRFEAEPDTEASAFYAWLKSNYADLSVVQRLRSEQDVVEFLCSNPEVVEAAKFLKPSESEVEKGGRRNNRVRTSVNVFAGVFECDRDPHMIGKSLKGTAFDVTPCGMGVALEEAVPADAILTFTIAPMGHPIILYRMTGEVRWSRHANGIHQHGIRLFDVDDAARWQQDFNERFVEV